MTIIMIRPSGEIALKSPRTRKNFEYTLVNNIKNSLKVEKIWISQGLIYLETNSDYIDTLSKMFGVAYFSPIIIYDFSDLHDIVNKAEEVFSEVVKDKTFAVRVKRIGKHNFSSLDAQREIGSRLYRYSRGVNLENPEVEVFLDIRNNKAYLYYKKYKGPRGLPVGIAGKTIVLFSGGIDSPVATWMIMKRGALPVILNFNLGGEIHKRVVNEELSVLKSWSGGHKLKVYMVKGMEVMIKIAKLENRKYNVVLLKRIMYRTAERLAEKFNAHSITTGESLSQVSSQTMKNLYVTEYGINMPIFRPLIGFDKEDIIDLARKIGTYEFSIKLPEYCAISSKSSTSVDLKNILELEEKINIDYDILIDSAEVIEI
ncbi:tRNA 4-thiouridine(8) synthase ThiI [Sulfolobus sp. A20]|uniref:tRNA uracil 4-sulfurtransferase ThiI n=1 Tax=Sulfolobaceae TaxID=118883 RepID=UPI000845C77C|nr:MULTISPECIES: tRNA uracil 4-sulfurtransferase ThiI [unclassified Sulfolobus]TRM75351.1 tRNA 4-thiouridine(8) synthase ThiI [Sulfolobus sp. A20-N-F8]TRM76366.1 tRNA 4-thiouridine(8) synthase ThiI [Sulfolobus sp. B5]TRM81310.1 tRNA 4-thiouridine(8) synthase ThiI [Sulfolobus sp. D5]TRM83379.1 tRNA 4-thiouridine(8) synthase ThiI [Sulfolobus sp. A20-N-F6]TRM84706.1 tRNA 4-thiouridine(8) synthase ThiI [Sulfolobus sp. F3]TRM87320.1 tRNA 4-thiouridine(8) synthase ThiI [Sulfolobus sp. C3]TRN00769.